MYALNHEIKSRLTVFNRGFFGILVLLRALFLPDACVAQFDTAHQRPALTEALIPTFLGNAQRNYYGQGAPDSLKLIWRLKLGSGVTNISTRLGDRIWSGCGWTGQPLLVREDSSLFLLQGAFDHTLKKIRADSGRVIWSYAFDDVIKGTASLWHNPKPTSVNDALVILQGSRRGYGKNLGSKIVPSFRAISYRSGEERWRHNVRRTPSISRDVDGSPLIERDTVYAAMENGLFLRFRPDETAWDSSGHFTAPRILGAHRLYTRKDVISHRGNIVTESSPARLGGRIYITSGSGHVYGYNVAADSIDWDFFIGSDMDGSPVVTADSCLLVAVEKQFIKGSGGVYKLNPALPPDSAVVWYAPSGDHVFATWLGGVIGSTGVNQLTRPKGYPLLAAFMGIDGRLVVVHQTDIDSAAARTSGAVGDGKPRYYRPKVVFSQKIGASISTPIFVGNKLIAAGYGGLYLFQYDAAGAFTLVDTFKGRSFEATPIVWEGRIYVGSRDGYLYCLGHPPLKKKETQ